MRKQFGLIFACLVTSLVLSTEVRAGKILLPQQSTTDGVSTLTGNAYFYCPAAGYYDDVAISNVTRDGAWNTLWQSKSSYIWPRSGSYSLTSGGSRIIWGSGNDTLLSTWRGSSGAKLWNIYAEDDVAYASVTDPIESDLKLAWSPYYSCP